MQSNKSNKLKNLFTPRWTWHSVLMAGSISLGIYLLLPYLETLSAPPEKNISIRTITSAPPPPPPPPKRIIKKAVETKPKTPKPKMQKLRHLLTPLNATMNLSMAMGDVGGDFGVNFGISANALGDQVKNIVFEISDLDEPPRTLVRLKPIYPTRAKMRKIEGFVIVEFIVTPSGMPCNVIVVSSQPGDIFRSSAIRAINRWRFTPGTKSGKAVTVRVRQKVEFTLN